MNASISCSFSPLCSGEKHNDNSRNDNDEDNTDEDDDDNDVDEDIDDNDSALKKGDASNLK